MFLGNHRIFIYFCSDGEILYLTCIMKYFIVPLLLMFIVFAQSKSFAQEIPVKQDSLDLKTEVTGDLPKSSDSLRTNQLPLRLPRLNPTENFLPQFTPYHRINIKPQQEERENFLPPILWHGAQSDFINSKSRTAIATTMPSPRLLMYSSATIGMVETPFFGKGYYYILDAGARYAVSPELTVGASGGYNSNFNVFPYWNAGINANLQVSEALMVEGGLTYLKTAGNMYKIDQSALLLDLHGRYRLSDDWYVNAYGGMPVSKQNNKPSIPMMPMMNTPYFGGSAEYWFKPSLGVEAGMIIVRDMFTGKMYSQPKIELLFRPGK